MSTATSTPVRVWDLPTRLFHWVLVLSMCGSFTTAYIGGNMMEWHFRLGYLALTLLGFRLVWGLIGGRYARFASFMFGPGAVLAYLRNASHKVHTLGHNPLGSGSVFAMLLVVSFQAITGLFSNDDIANEGPLVKHISKELSDRISGLHHWNQYLIMALVALHIVAILYYRFGKHESLVVPMITGDKLSNDPSLASRDGWSHRLLALVTVAISGLLVWIVVR